MAYLLFIELGRKKKHDYLYPWASHCYVPYLSPLYVML